MFRVGFGALPNQIIDFLNQRAKQLWRGLLVLNVIVDNPLPVSGFQIPVLVEVRPEEVSQWA